MNESEMEEYLREVLEHDDSDCEPTCGTTSKVQNIHTFAETTMLTRNKGLVVKMKDGSEFQITIVKAK